jgi:NlpC/P60 family putative phage cell wall peptidase
MNDDCPYGKRVVAAARGWLGTPYLHQASTRGRGCDCLGLVRGVWRELFGTEPLGVLAYSRDHGEFAASENLMRLARNLLIERAHPEPEPGDVILFRWPRQRIAKHLGIACGGGRFIHAWERAGVVEVVLHHGWRTRIAAIFSFPCVAAQAKRRRVNARSGGGPSEG